MASAVLCDGLLYAGTRSGIMDVTDAATGKVVYRKRLEIGELFSSMTLAGDAIVSHATPGADPEPHEPVDAARVEAQARRGDELLVGLVGGCSLLAVGSALVLGFSDGPWARLLALATGIALLMRAQLFRYTAQVATVLAAGLGSLVALGLGLAIHTPDGLLKQALAGDRTDLDIRTVWLLAAIAAAAALVTAIGLMASRSGLTPFWGRFLEIAEGFVLLTLVPLALAVFDVYTSVRSMTS